MTGWDVFSGRASVPAGMLAELAALRAALPGYDVILTSHSPAHRFEAIRRDPGPGTWCVISSRPRRPVAGTRAPRPAGDPGQAAADPDRPRAKAGPPSPKLRPAPASSP